MTANHQLSDNDDGADDIQCLIPGSTEKRKLHSRALEVDVKVAQRKILTYDILHTPRTPWTPYLLSSEPGSVQDSASQKRTLKWSSAYILIISRVVGSGIFAAPGVIAQSTGSVGLALLLWFLGAIVSAYGLTVSMELGCMLPRSGGDNVYLEFIYDRPRFLASTIIAVQAMLLGFTASNCVIFVKYILFCLWSRSGIRLSAAIMCCWTHCCYYHNTWKMVKDGHHDSKCLRMDQSCRHCVHRYCWICSHCCPNLRSQSITIQLSLMVQSLRRLQLEHWHSRYFFL